PDAATPATSTLSLHDALPISLRLALLAVATGVLAAALGSWVVLRRQAFLAHASGATAFAGASVAGALTLPVLPLAIVTAASVAADRKSTRLNSSHVKISYAVF